MRSLFGLILFQEFARTSSCGIKLHSMQGKKNKKPARQAVLLKILLACSFTEAQAHNYLNGRTECIPVCFLHYRIEDCELTGKGALLGEPKWRVKDGAIPRSHADMYNRLPAERPRVSAEDHRAASAARDAGALVHHHVALAAITVAMPPSPVSPTVSHIKGGAKGGAKDAVVTMIVRQFERERDLSAAKETAQRVGLVVFHSV